MEESDITISSGAVYLNTNWDESIKAPIYENIQILAEAINERIQGRTPVDTGALVSSEKFEINQDTNIPDLINFYADDAEQLAAWGRVYVLYQEGPPLGLSTYTNDPHQMYFLSESEDLSEAQAYLDMTVGDGIRSIVAGEGIQQ